MSKRFIQATFYVETEEDEKVSNIINQVYDAISDLGGEDIDIEDMDPDL